MLSFVLGILLLSAGGALAQDWPQWRGPNRDNKVVGFVAPKSWPKELTKKWTAPVGVGEASPVLLGDKVFTFGRIDGNEVAICLDAATGKEVWKEKYPAAALTNAAAPFPGPRSTPAASDGKVCTLGVHGIITCRNAATGKELWRKETKEPKFATSSSPIIADGMCIVYGKDLTAYDLATGAVKWQWKDGGTPYGSPVFMTVDGVKQVVTPFDGGLVGVSAADGKFLWKVTSPVSGYANSYSTPVVEGATLVYSFSTPVPKKAGGKGGGGGSMIALKIEKKGDAFTTTELWKKSFAPIGYVTPTLKDGLLYGVSSGLTFFCLDAKTGEQLWADSAKRGVCGSILDAGAVMLSLTSDSKLVAFEPSGTAYKQVAQYTVSNEETWGVPIIAGNRVYVKDKGGTLTLWTIE
jgi:outer membrane protein assembly factor BamB